MVFGDDGVLVEAAAAVWSLSEFDGRSGLRLWSVSEIVGSF